MVRVVAQRKRQKKNITSAVACVTSTFNNTVITISDVQGNVLAWSSAGVAGFSGSRQSTPYAAQLAAEDVAKKAQVHGVKNLEVLLKGPGNGREAAVRSLYSSGFTITLISDITPVAHNGCRPPKRRRT